MHLSVLLHVPAATQAVGHYTKGLACSANLYMHCATIEAPNKEFTSARLSHDGLCLLGHMMQDYHMMACAFWVT